MLKSLKLGQTVWYAGIICTIDSLNSGLIYKGNGDIRIFPMDRKLHEIDGNGKLAADGKWIKEDDELFSTKKPPEKIIFDLSKEKRALEKYSAKKYKLLTEYLAKGPLLLKVQGYADMLVHATTTGHICVDKQCPGIAISDVELAYFMVLVSAKDEWYII